MVLVILAALIAIEGLVYWGIGAFVCWAFAIPFTFTFAHGVALALIATILSGIFKVTVTKITD